MLKSKVSSQEYQEIENQSSAALEILEGERFQFLRDYFTNTKKYVEDSILNNTVREVQEVVPISEKITRIFKQPKQVQVDELAGQYKLITKFFEDMQYYAQLKKDLDTEIAEKRVTLE